MAVVYISLTNYLGYNKGDELVLCSLGESVRCRCGSDGSCYVFVPIAYVPHIKRWPKAIPDWL